MRYAIIDLGTNTFNLLIAEESAGKVEFLYKAKMASKLGENGINKNQIHADACQRGIQILKTYKQIIDKHQVTTVRAIATSAIRTASNGRKFIDKIASETGYRVDVISGEREAELICTGVLKTGIQPNEPYVILDIGGGSNEFIVVENGQMTKLKSFPLGMARLLEQFQPSDPITSTEIQTIETYLHQELDGFISELKTKGVKTLVGSSGSFDTLLSLIANKFYNASEFKSRLFTEINLSEFDQITNSLIESTLAERHKMPGMDLIRVEMMVLAILFTRFVVSELNVSQLFQVKYALKEGVLFSMIKS